MKQDYSTLSYWLDSVPGSLQPRPPLLDDIQADISIIGAGYTGLWTAYYLKQLDPSLNIVILEAEIAGFGASGRNGGWCSGFLSGIDRWLQDPSHRAAAIRLQKLMFDSVSEVGRVTQRESIDCHFDQSGALEIAVLPIQLERLQNELEHLHQLGFDDADYRLLTADEVRGMLNVDKAQGGMLMSHCAAIHPARLARGLADVLTDQGVTIYEQSPVLEIQPNELRTTQARVKTGTTIIATEGYSRTLPGYERRLIPVHSMMVATEPLSEKQIDSIGFRKRFTFGNGDRVVTYGQLTDDRRIAFGCRGTYHFGSRIQNQFTATDVDFELVQQTLLRFFPALHDIRFTHAWGGAMGVSRSMQPYVRYDPSRQQAAAGGYFGNGVGATHLAGKTLADLVLARDSERIHTPWVNPAYAEKNWEPEPLRWLGIKSARVLMHWADRAEYSDSWLASPVCRTLEKLLP